jgi:hypothetical protein
MGGQPTFTRQSGCPRSAATRALRGQALLPGGADLGYAGWQRDVSGSLTKLGEVRLAAGDRAGALLAYEGSLAIRRELAAPLIRRELLRLGLLVVNPAPYGTHSPIVSVVDFDRLGDGERLVLFLVQHAPDVHLRAVAEHLPQLPTCDQAFIAQRQSSALPRGLGVRLSPRHVVALRLAEAMVRSGEGELVGHWVFST